MWQRGQVLSLRRHGVGIVWSSDRTGTALIPIGGYNGPPPHRAEIRIADAAQHLACGVSFKWPVIRCHQLFRVPLIETDDAEIIGAVPAPLLSRVIATVTREAATQVAEQRMFLRPPDVATAARTAVVL